MWSLLGEERCINGFGGKHEEKRTLGKRRRRWDDDITMYIKEMGWGAWTGLIWFRIGTRSGFL